MPGNPRCRQLADELRRLGLPLQALKISGQTGDAVTWLQLRERFVALAAEASCTPAQLALAWLLAQGDDVVPIPGTTRTDHLLDDLVAAALALPAAMIEQVGALIRQHTVAGPRYGPQATSEVDTETF